MARSHQYKVYCVGTDNSDWQNVFSFDFTFTEGLFHPIASAGNFVIAGPRQGNPIDVQSCFQIALNKNRSVLRPIPFMSSVSALPTTTAECDNLVRGNQGWRDGGSSWARFKGPDGLDFWNRTYIVVADRINMAVRGIDEAADLVLTIANLTSYGCPVIDVGVDLEGGCVWTLLDNVAEGEPWLIKVDLHSGRPVAIVRAPSAPPPPAKWSFKKVNKRWNSFTGLAVSENGCILLVTSAPRKMMYHVDVCDNDHPLPSPPVRSIAVAAHNVAFYEGTQTALAIENNAPSLHIVNLSSGQVQSKLLTGLGGNGFGCHGISRPIIKNEYVVVAQTYQDAFYMCHVAKGTCMQVFPVPNAHSNLTTVDTELKQEDLRTHHHPHHH